MDWKIWLSFVTFRLQCWSWQCLAISISLLFEWRRCFSHSVHHNAHHCRSATDVHGTLSRYWKKKFPSFSHFLIFAVSSPLILFLNILVIYFSFAFAIHLRFYGQNSCLFTFLIYFIYFVFLFCLFHLLCLQLHFIYFLLFTTP